jgi:GMP synthase (glutamine-hydrolysing)
MAKSVRDLRIAVLQTGRTIDSALEEHGDYDEMCKHVVGRTADTADTYAVLDGIFPESLEGYDVLVITGSKHGVYEDHSWIAPLESLLRDAMARGLKIIGICFGHQILAQALGGVVEKSERGLGVGLMDYELIGADGARTSHKLYAWHQDQVIKAPPGAQVVATSDFCPIAGLRYGDQAISFQPHPEFSAQYMRALVEARTGTSLTKQQASQALESLQQQDDSKRLAQLFQAFMKGDF